MKVLIDATTVEHAEDDFEEWGLKYRVLEERNINGCQTVEVEGPRRAVLGWLAEEGYGEGEYLDLECEACRGWGYSVFETSGSARVPDGTLEVQRCDACRGSDPGDDVFERRALLALSAVQKGELAKELVELVGGLVMANLRQKEVLEKVVCEAIDEFFRRDR